MEGNTDTQLCAEVNKRGCCLLETGQYMDCKFLVGVEPHQEVIASHKLILAMASCVFEAMFYSDLSEKSNPIHIIDILPETFKLLLKYIYTRKSNINSADEACNLYYAAKKYMLQHLLEECSSYLWHHVNTDNVWNLFEFAQFYEDKQLLLKCEKIFSTETKEVLNNGKFEDAELNTVITVFSQDTLDIDCETTLIEAAARYAKAQNIMVTARDADQSPSDGSLSEMSEYSDHKVGINGVNTENSLDSVVQMEKVENGYKKLEYGTSAPEPASTALIKDNSKIRRIVEKIRFLCLSPEQFAKCSERTSILTLSEENALIMNLVSSKCNVPLPSGISTRSTGRRHVYMETPSNEDDSRKNGSFTYTVYAFTHQDDILSPPCYVRSLPWQLHVTKANEYDWRGLSVRCSGMNNPKWSCEVDIVVNIYKSDKPGFIYFTDLTLNASHLFCRESSTFYFSTDSVVWGNCVNEDGSVKFVVTIKEVRKEKE